jgi:hypothetical protein
VTGIEPAPKHAAKRRRRTVSWSTILQSILILLVVAAVEKYWGIVIPLP